MLLPLLLLYVALWLPALPPHAALSLALLLLSLMATPTMDAGAELDGLYAFHPLCASSTLTTTAIAFAMACSTLCARSP